ncbi:MAG: hypothetical protein JNM42_11975 [Propionivibrio sp.]|uniref:hypothetical protein n=1 Tax=Propionivibrio sp. TaxID=2212460 RepID=UPI001A4FB9EE|nr:hypothetical protein [Propionivibrio sp.]MBL8415146.1 hypothetical protein [Propionivibrio sp.]
MNINFDPARRPGLLTQGLTAIVGLVLLAVAFMFSLVFFALVAVAGLVFWMYFWWKTRALRKQLRERMDEPVRAQDFEPPVSGPAAGGEIIEGEAVRVVDAGRQLDQAP